MKSLDAKDVIVRGYLQPLGVWNKALTVKSEVLHQIGNDDGAEKDLLELQKQVDDVAADVLVFTQDLLQKCSAKIISANSQCLTDINTFQIKQDELKLRTKNAFDNFIVERFQNWRLEDVKKLQVRIQLKLEADETLILSKFAHTKKRQLQECETLSKLQAEMTKLRLSLSEYPLQANRRIRKYDQQLFLQKETVIYSKYSKFKFLD